MVCCDVLQFTTGGSEPTAEAAAAPKDVALGKHRSITGADGSDYHPGFAVLLDEDDARRMAVTAHGTLLQRMVALSEKMIYLIAIREVKMSFKRIEPARAPATTRADVYVENTF